MQGDVVPAQADVVHRLAVFERHLETEHVAIIGHAFGHVGDDENGRGTGHHRTFVGYCNLLKHFGIPDTAYQQSNGRCRHHHAAGLRTIHRGSIGNSASNSQLERTAIAWMPCWTRSNHPLPALPASRRSCSGLAGAWHRRPCLGLRHRPLFFGRTAARYARTARSRETPC